ncbi:sigma-w pathway protein ysdB [Guptibacillus hwajinpoensis]|uniref:sigma-w pathway protein ysdB n=1 Tax=Guptibacillus hwajinpoensis TaxID=208199 RepID=UPI001CFEAC59|nr:sigma-w pathway protein ysdB [Pseudalkalibacillus hwajinpoensis]WLR60781.1 sigma-w pathway protein ysdB [Pseudalkalibacillus hwajinpoensis]
MIIILFRLVILVAMVLIAYSVIRFFMDPKRKLEKAHDYKEYYFFDDSSNVRKNFLVTYKGALFEGEKYLGTTENSFDIITLSVGVKNASELYLLEKEDFYFLEKEMDIRYPSAKIEWKSPVKEFLRHRENT